MQVNFRKYGTPDWVLYIWAILKAKKFSGTLLIDFRNGVASENYRLQITEDAYREQDQSKRKEREDAYSSNV